MYIKHNAILINNPLSLGMLQRVLMVAIFERYMSHEGAYMQNGAIVCNI